MSIDVKVDELIDALNRNTEALLGITAAGKARAAASKPAEAAAASDDAPPARSRRAARTEEEAAPAAAEEGATRRGRPSNALKEFTTAVEDFLNFDEDNLTKKQVDEERAARKSLCVDIAKAFKVAKLSDLAEAEFEKVTTALDSFADGNEVDVSKLAGTRRARA